MANDKPVFTSITVPMFFDRFVGPILNGAGFIISGGGHKESTYERDGPLDEHEKSLLHVQMLDAIKRECLQFRTDTIEEDDQG